MALWFCDSGVIYVCATVQCYLFMLLINFNLIVRLLSEINLIGLLLLQVRCYWDWNFLAICTYPKSIPFQ